MDSIVTEVRRWGALALLVWSVWLVTAVGAHLDPGIHRFLELRDTPAMAAPQPVR